MRHMWEDRNVLSQTSRKMETPEDVEIKKKMQQAQLTKWHHWRTHLSQPFKHIRKKEMPNTSPTFKIVQAISVARAHFHRTLTSPMVNPSLRWWDAAIELACPDLMFRDEYKSFGWTWTKNWTKIEQRSLPSAEGIFMSYLLDVATASRWRSLQHCLEASGFNCTFHSRGSTMVQHMRNAILCKGVAANTSGQKGKKRKNGRTPLNTKNKNETFPQKWKIPLNSKVILQLGTTRDSAFQKTAHDLTLLGIASANVSSSSKLNWH